MATWFNGRWSEYSFVGLLFGYFADIAVQGMHFDLLQGRLQVVAVLAFLWRKDSGSH